MLADLEARESVCKDKTVGDSLKTQAIALSKRANVMCKWTSFVSVAERDNAVVGQLVTVPVQMNSRNSELGVGRSIARGRGMMRMSTYRSEEHTSELQSLMRISYAVFCLKKKKQKKKITDRRVTK